MPDVVFDIVGTCIGYDVMIDAIDKRIGDRLRKYYINPKLFFNAWGTAVERDFSYLSQVGLYKPTKVILKATFYRCLHHAGIEDPKAFATDEDLEFLCDEWQKLTARPELAAMWKLLRDNGFTVWCLTDGDKSRVSGYFKNSNVEMPDENIVSCDSLQIGKPDPNVYKFMLEKIPGKGNDAWFAAGHSWDTCAAQQAGFKTAWSNVHEKYLCEDIFGQPDVVAGGLVDMAEKLIAEHRRLTSSA